MKKTICLFFIQFWNFILAFLCHNASNICRAPFNFRLKNKKKIQKKYHGMPAKVYFKCSLPRQKGSEMTAFVFDMDDTLYLRSAPYMETFRHFFPKEKGIDPSLLLKRSRYWSDFEFERFKKGEISRDAMNALRVLDTLGDFSLPGDMAMAQDFQRIYEDKQRRIHLLPGLKDILESLKKKGFFLGMISNGSVDHQLMKYHALGLEDLIPPSRVLISSETPFHKPDPRIFTLYLEKMGIQRGEVWYIGDSVENDVLPARKAGLHTILCRWEEGVEEGSDADRTARSVDELASILEEITSSCS